MEYLYQMLSDDQAVMKEYYLKQELIQDFGLENFKYWVVKWMSVLIYVFFYRIHNKQYETNIELIFLLLHAKLRTYQMETKAMAIFYISYCFKAPLQIIKH